MNPNPILGVMFHWLGGLSSASFYVPYRGVRRWSWEVYWLTGGVFSWLIAPWFFAAIQTHDLIGVLARTPGWTAASCIAFGMLWGFGGLTYGLTMRYLGLSLGMAVVLGLCTVFGTLVPPLFLGDFTAKLLATPSGNIILLGLGVTLAGIGLVAWAGARKNAALTVAQKVELVAEFNFRKGSAVAIFSGVMSACFAFGLAAGEPVKALSKAVGTGPLWAGLPTLCLVMFGGLVTNAAWCGWLIAKNRSAGQWIGRSTVSGTGAAPPLIANYALSGLAGTLWYFQFFFYTMGESQMGRFGFSSWTLHMASIIIFGTLWGFGFREWRGTSRSTRAIVWGGVAMLVIATGIIGYGNRLAIGS